ncbi:MAG: glutamine amidotransferase [Myxococcota bacterium]
MEWLLGGTLGSSGTLEWTAPQWIVLSGVAAALLAWGASLPGERSWAARIAEAVLWGLALTGLVIAVAKPMWIEEEGRTEPGRVALLVDASSSMGVLEDGVARSDGVAPVVAHVTSQVDRLEVFHFGDELYVGEPDAYTLSGTDLEGALDALSERLAGEKLAGVVVVTDGLDRGLLRRRFSKEASPAPPALGGPLTIYQVGSRTELKDLAVRSVDSGGYAFLRHPFHVKAEIEGTGFEKSKVEVKLLRDGAVVTQKPVSLDANGKGHVEFEVVPEKAGRFAYEVQVPQYEADAVPANNSMPIVVRVVRDKIRVLQVAGAPSWDVKFLRRFLKGDPSVDLVSFFILRTGRDMDNRYSDSELSLIAFPYTDLFSTDLWSFDAVIFQNFDYEDYFVGQGPMLLDNLRRYVHDDGGALVMIGGDRSFGLGGYANTALGEILPVEVDRNEKPSLVPFQPRLTAQGKRHPLTRLVADGIENEVWWARLHDMDGTNVVLRAKDDAAVLLDHPSLSASDGTPLPILSVREAGAGRTMALTVDSSWRWSMSEAAEGRGNQAYLRFWKNGLRWLMKDSSVSRVTVDTPRENYGVGDEVRLVVRARDPGFAALPGAKATAQVTVNGQVQTLEGETGADGDVVLTLGAKVRGTHRVKVVVTRDGAEVGTADTVYAVTARDPELDEVAPDDGFLAALAARVDGRFHPAGELGPVLTDPSAGRVVWDRRETALWRAPLLALLVALFAGSAWIVRRRSGLR